MNDYQYIENLFTSVLKLSSQIDGRFYVCPHFGTEISSDLLNKTLEQVNVGKKYPLVLMMPPIGRPLIKDPSWLVYTITTFWLDTTYYGDNNQVSEFTRTSVTEIEKVWGYMSAAAIDFHAVIKKVQVSFLNEFRVVGNDYSISPITEVGADRASGVRLDFEAQLPKPCEIVDYNLNDLKSFVV